MWRLACPIEAGVAMNEAQRLAASPANLHEMLDAWSAGCDLPTLCRIFL